MMKVPVRAKISCKRGSLLTDVAMGLLVIGMIVGAAWQVSGFLGRMNTNQLTSWQLAQIHKAAQAYITQNQATVEATAQAAGGRYAIVPSALQTPTASVNYLSPSFVNSAPNGGQYAVIIRRVGAGQLQHVVVLYGGTQLTDADCGDVARNLGGDGGCVYRLNTSLISGSGGVWRANVSDFNVAPYTPATGSPVAASYYEGTQIVSPYLHRYAGTDPEANRMHTAIDMNSNAINNASAVEIGNETIQEPQAAMINALFEGDYLANSGNLTIGRDLAVTRNQMVAGTLGVTGLVTASQGAALAVTGVAAGGACSPNGRIAATSAAASELLICKLGTWQGVSSPGTSLATATGLSGATWPDALLCQHVPGGRLVLYLEHHYPLGSGAESYGVGYTSTVSDSVQAWFSVSGSPYAASNAGDCAGQSVQALVAAGRGFWLSGRTNP